jgi:hypothetical protein
MRKHRSLRNGLPDESNRPFAALQGQTDEKGRKGEKAGFAAVRLSPRLERHIGTQRGSAKTVGKALIVGV